MRILLLCGICAAGCGSPKTMTAPPTKEPEKPRIAQIAEAKPKSIPQQAEKPAKKQEAWKPLPFTKPVDPPEEQVAKVNRQKPAADEQQPKMMPAQEQQPKLAPMPGVIQGVRGAVARSVTQNEFNNLRLFIDTASLASGEMPTPAQIYDAVSSRMGDPKLAAAIQDGSIVLTGSRSREGVWAYEAAALKSGGMVLKSDGIERMTANQLQQALRD